MAEADSFDPGVLDRLKQLQDKYAAMGQDLTSYLDGLLHADFPTYWDYINLDTLLSLQQPVTPFPDEQIFVMYHQITELYFKLSLLEIDQIHAETNIDATTHAPPGGMRGVEAMEHDAGDFVGFAGPVLPEGRVSA